MLSCEISEILKNICKRLLLEPFFDKVADSSTGVFQNSFSVEHLQTTAYGTKYSRMDQVKFVKDSLQKIWSDMVCWGRPYHFKFFRGCLPQISLGPSWNTLTHMKYLSLSFKLYIQIIRGNLFSKFFQKICNLRTVIFIKIITWTFPTNCQQSLHQIHQWNS